MDAIKFWVAQSGDFVIVMEVDPASGFLTQSGYRISSPDPSKPVWRRVGDYSLLPEVSKLGWQATLKNRLYNTPFNVALRRFHITSSISGELDKIDPQSLPYILPSESNITDEHFKAAIQAIDQEILTKINSADPFNKDEISDDKKNQESPTDWSRLWSVTGIAWFIFQIFPVFLLIYSMYKGSKWRKWREKIDTPEKPAGEPTPTKELEEKELEEGKIYTKKDIEDAFKRFSKNVLAVNERKEPGALNVNDEKELESLAKIKESWKALDTQGILKISDANIEGAFLNNLFLIYVMSYAWNKRKGLDTQEAQQNLEKLDTLAISLSKFLTVEVGRGSDAERVRYASNGKVDAQIWNKMELFLSKYSQEMREALSNQDGTSFEALFNELQGLLAPNAEKLKATIEKEVKPALDAEFKKMNLAEIDLRNEDDKKFVENWAVAFLAMKEKGSITFKEALAGLVGDLDTLNALYGKQFTLQDLKTSPALNGQSASTEPRLENEPPLVYELWTILGAKGLAQSEAFYKQKNG